MRSAKFLLAVVARTGAFREFTTYPLVRPNISSSPVSNRLVFNSYRYSTSTQIPESSGAELYSEVDFDAITGGDEAALKRLKVIMLEVEVLRQDGHKVPNTIKTDRWKELMSLPSRSQRMKTLNFLWGIEVKKESERKKKEARRIEREAGLEEARRLRDNPVHINYGLKGNTIFLRIYDAAIDQANNSKIIQAMMFGPDLVIDCSYDKHMTIKEAGNCAKQLSYVFAENRAHRQPFNLIFANANKESLLFQKLNKIIPPLYEPDFPLIISEKSYLDLYPKERLVYLTPHCRNDLMEYNHDDIYIIGGMVDKTNCEHLSLAKAKAEGLRMAKFPLDRFLAWQIGTKSLTINQCLSIMLDLKETNDWEHALQHVPRRKLRQDFTQPKHSSVSGRNWRSKRLFENLEF